MPLAKQNNNALADASALYSFSMMRFDRNCGLRVFVDGEQNAIFELLSKKVPIMAFRFNKLTLNQIHWHRERFARCLEAHCSIMRDMGLDINKSASLRKLVPLHKVEQLPAYEMWSIDSAMAEEMFWCSQELLMNCYPGGNDGCFVDINLRTGETVAYFRFADMDSDSAPVLKGALHLRQLLRIENQIRVEYRHRNKRACFYIPSVIRLHQK